MTAAGGVTAIHHNPAELLQRLVRFRSVNPPGDERECVEYIGKLLQAAGIPVTIVAKEPERPNLIARLRGSGDAPPLLLQGHADVVPTEGQEWSVPPFEGRIMDGYVWGRGTLDMKDGLTMMVCSLLRAVEEGFVPRGDILLAVLSDEEAGGDCGARFLVEQHADLFEGVRYSIGEVGGYSLHLEGKRFYPVQMTEKQVCWLRAVIKGPGGHGSVPMRDGAMARLGHILTALNTHDFPVHITDAAEMMIESLAENLEEPAATRYRSLLDPSRTDDVLREMGEVGKGFHPLLHNTVNATMVSGGSKINVIPSEIELKLDCRLLPGFGPDDVIEEIEKVCGEELELQVERFEPVPDVMDISLLPALESILRELDPGMSCVLPLLVSGGTDGRHFGRLGIQTYGFTPVSLKEDEQFMQMAHAADERISIEGLEFGTAAMYSLLQRYGQA